MLQRFLLLAMLLSVTSCATEPEHQIVWYLISPRPSAGYPYGDINSDPVGWERIQTFHTSAECEDSVLKIHHDGRPMDCIASNDVKLNPL